MISEVKHAWNAKQPIFYRRMNAYFQQSLMKIVCFMKTHIVKHANNNITCKTTDALELILAAFTLIEIKKFVILVSMVKKLRGLYVSEYYDCIYIL